MYFCVVLSSRSVWLQLALCVQTCNGVRGLKHLTFVCRSGRSCGVARTTKPADRRQRSPASRQRKWKKWHERREKKKKVQWCKAPAFVLHRAKLGILCLLLAATFPGALNWCIFRRLNCWFMGPAVLKPGLHPLWSLWMAVEVPWAGIQSCLYGFLCHAAKTKFAAWFLWVTFFPLNYLQQSGWNYFLSLNHQSSCEGLRLCWPESDPVWF